MLYTSEYLIASNNSINDNKYNAEKVSKTTSYKIKKMLKPLLRLLKNSNKSQKKMHSFDEDSNQSDCYSYTTEECCSNYSEMDDNSANEALEAKLMNEINNCMDNAAIYVYGDNNTCDLTPVTKEQTFVPVHFYRNEAGTFFWTTMQRPADCDLIEPHCFSDHQVPQMQYGDRWVQA